jgi:hypothetical protein
MKSFTIYIRGGGLMEDPCFHWDRHGIAAGETPADACVNLFKNDKLFDAKTMTVWGWKLGYENEDGGITVINPVET